MTTDIAVEFIPAEESIEWAERAASELDAQIRDFFKGDVARIITEFDPDTGENVQKLKFTSDIPNDFKRKATESLNNARHSFDQSVFAARNILAGRSRTGVNYPWATGPTDLCRLLENREIDPRLWDTIRAHEPYGTSDTYTGGDNLIRTLATIANNKHTVGLTVDAQIATTRLPNMYGSFVQQLNIMIPRWNTRTKEADLVRWIGDVQFNGDYQVSFQICLEDTRLSKPVNVVTALCKFTERAKTVCQTIKAKCKEISV